MDWSLQGPAQASHAAQHAACVAGGAVPVQESHSSLQVSIASV